MRHFYTKISLWSGAPEDPGIVHTFRASAAAGISLHRTFRYVDHANLNILGQNINLSACIDGNFVGIELNSKIPFKKIGHIGTIK